MTGANAMTTEPVRAWAIIKPDGTLDAYTDGGAMLWADANEAKFTARAYGQGAQAIPVLIIPDDPASRKVREAEQRLLAAFEAASGSIHHAEACPVSDGFPGHCVCGVTTLNDLVDALLAARRESQP